MNSLLKAQELDFVAQESYRLPRPLSVEQGLSVKQPGCGNDDAVMPLGPRRERFSFSPPNSPQQSSTGCGGRKMRSQVSRDNMNEVFADVQEGSDSSEEERYASPRTRPKRPRRRRGDSYYGGYSSPESPRLTFVSRLRAWAVTLSLACFIVLLLWEVRYPFFLAG